MLVGVVVCLAVCVVPLFLNLTGFLFSGGFGGDCPETLSYGGVTISGNVWDNNGSAVEGVQIHARKAQGGCPQSVAFDEVVTSDAQGSFQIFGALHLGDPAIEVEVVADGYSSCRFSYNATSTQSANLSLEIVLGGSLQVQGVATQFWLGQEDSAYQRDLPSCS